jgi:hypothetical protein
MGFSHRLQDRFRSNANANRYPSNSLINRLSMLASLCLQLGPPQSSYGDDAVEFSSDSQFTS